MACEMCRTRVRLLRSTTGDAIFRATGRSHRSRSSPEAALSILHSDRDTTPAEKIDLSLRRLAAPLGSPLGVRDARDQRVPLDPNSIRPDESQLALDRNPAGPIVMRDRAEFSLRPVAASRWRSRLITRSSIHPPMTRKENRELAWHLAMAPVV